MDSMQRGPVALHKPYVCYWSSVECQDSWYPGECAGCLDQDVRVSHVRPIIQLLGEERATWASKKNNNASNDSNNSGNNNSNTSNNRNDR